MSKSSQPPKITLAPAPDTIRVEFGGQTIAESSAALILQEGSYPPVAYIPKADVRCELMQDSDHHTFCPYKGTAQYWSISAGDRVAENAVWGYPEAIDAVAEIQDCVAFYWDRMDAWYLGGKAISKPAF